MNLVFLDFGDTDTLLDTHLNIPSIPTLVLIISPNDSSQKIFLDSILEDEANISDLLHCILSKRYLNNCAAPRTCEEYNFVQLFDMCDNDFKQAVRTKKTGFIWLLDQI